MLLILLGKVVAVLLWLVEAAPKFWLDHIANSEYIKRTDQLHTIESMLWTTVYYELHVL